MEVVSADAPTAAGNVEAEGPPVAPKSFRCTKLRYPEGECVARRYRSQQKVGGQTHTRTDNSLSAGIPKQLILQKKNNDVVIIVAGVIVVEITVVELIDVGFRYLGLGT